MCLATACSHPMFTSASPAATRPSRAMIPSPMTWLAIPSRSDARLPLCVAERDRSWRASSGSRSASNSMRLLRSAEEHRDLLAFAFGGSAGGENLLSEIGGGVRRWRPCSLLGGRRGGWGSGAGVVRPHDALLVLADRVAVGISAARRGDRSRSVCIQLESALGRCGRSHGPAGRSRAIT